MQKKSTTIIIIILWSFFVISVVYNPILKLESILGIIGLTAVSVLLLFKKYDLSLVTLTFILTLSTFNIITFGNAFYASFGIFQLFPLTFLLILIFTNIKALILLKERSFGYDTEDTNASKKRRIELFKLEFKPLATEELMRKVQNETLVEEARIAIRQILEERSENNQT